MSKKSFVKIESDRLKNMMDAIINYQLELQAFESEKAEAFRREINCHDRIKQLNLEKAELIEILKDINNRIKSGSFNIPMYETYYMANVEELLNKYGGEL